MLYLQSVESPWLSCWTGNSNIIILSSITCLHDKLHEIISSDKNWRHFCRVSSCNGTTPSDGWMRHIYQIINPGICSAIFLTKLNYQSQKYITYYERPCKILRGKTYQLVIIFTEFLLLSIISRYYTEWLGYQPEFGKLDENIPEINTYVRSLLYRTRLITNKNNLYRTGTVPYYTVLWEN